MYEVPTQNITPIGGHTSAETAHLTFAYPFGSFRCVRREWIETATKGAKKDEQRMVMQTSGPKTFNHEYTRRIDTDGLESANEWAKGEIAAGRVAWNAPKGSTYHEVMALYLRPMDDGSGRESIHHAVLWVNSGPKDFAAFRTTFGPVLTPEQIKRVDLLEKVSRHYNKSMWADTPTAG